MCFWGKKIGTSGFCHLSLRRYPYHSNATGCWLHLGAQELRKQTGNNHSRTDVRIFLLTSNWKNSIYPWWHLLWQEKTTTFHNNKKNKQKCDIRNTRLHTVFKNINLFKPIKIRIRDSYASLAWRHYCNLRIKNIISWHIFPATQDMGRAHLSASSPLVPADRGPSSRVTAAWYHSLAAQRQRLSAQSILCIHFTSCTWHLREHISICDQKKKKITENDTGDLSSEFYFSIFLSLRNPAT